jgi:5'-methylthioadenosine phosphorylase
MAVLGVIGGSGLYDLPGLERVHETTVTTPFGDPSSPIVRGHLGNTELAFLARHGRGHTLTPTEVPYRANIWALKSLGVTHILSVSAVGSLREEFAPGSAIVPDQIIDRTAFPRPRTFFEDGIVAHVGIADPFCGDLRATVTDVAGAIFETVGNAGTYLVMEGPQFSTRAESALHQSWGCTVVGMTAMPEARLAREAGICYATLAMVTDYDVWHELEADVTVELVQQIIHDNVERGKRVVAEVVARGLPECTCGCASALEGAIITAPERITPDIRERLSLLLGDQA